MENQRHDRCKEWEARAEAALDEDNRLPTLDEIHESAARGLIACFQAHAMTRQDVEDLMGEQFPAYAIPAEYWQAGEAGGE